MQTVLTYSWSQVDQELRDLGIQPGGVWKPPSCQARTRAIVVVPFRDRFVHLKAFLIHTHPILQRQMLDYRIVVVEQHLPPVFNKAAVMNAAFLEMKSRGWAADCVVFHDVDLLMEDDRHIVCHGVNATRRTFHHYGAYLSKWNYTRCCGVTIGGGFAVHPSHFEEVNGFTNYIFGWGGEDDDFYYRVLRHHYKMIRPSRILAKYATIPHVSDRRNPKMRASKSKNAPERDGVDSLQYTLSRYAETEYYTWLLIDLNATDLMYEYPTPIYGQLPGKCELSPTWVSVDVNDDDSCRRECEERGPCTAYHFEKRNEMKVEDGRCSLKSDWPPCGIDSLLIAQGKSNEIDSSYIKGVDLKLQEMAVLYSAYEADCHKHDTSRLSSSPLRCSQTCATDDRCGAFSYVPGHPGTCWFKSKCSKLVPSSTTKSYVKRSFL
ncbi:hypothetical protein CAPTEDRAFT_178397 [Capitella teleta]|uniref:Beta-1,4-galactosyltransferase n=1 Tax=Capitella teleta TaxID=283909 RepID=R7VFQ5_CAPTE|nr:hypothetical protein CAPTEDRAFT_178397 [Capitella teleta]|eukprot:ELU17412.1 hypothetical protein CAPTEDRAFT_178397 [Capitella teleta]